MTRSPGWIVVTVGGTVRPPPAAAASAGALREQRGRAVGGWANRDDAREDDDRDGACEERFHVYTLQYMRAESLQAACATLHEIACCCVKKLSFARSVLCIPLRHPDD